MRRSAIIIPLSLLMLGLAPQAQAAPPDNDDFANAVVLSLPASNPIPLETAEASVETGEPEQPLCVIGLPSHFITATVWYKYTPVADVAVSFDTFGSLSTGDFDTILAVYRQDGAGFAGLTELACSDDSGPNFTSISRVALPLKANKTYYFQVGGDSLSPLQPEGGSLTFHFVQRKFHPGVVRGPVWYLNSGFDGTSDLTFGMGAATDDPFVAPVTAVSIHFFRLSTDGIFKPVVRRGNEWFFNFWFEGAADNHFAFGFADDFPILGDWDGDGIATPGVVRGNHWYLANEQGAVTHFQYGSPTDYPIVGDWDGDRKVTPGVIRGNAWLLNNSTDASADESFGFGSFTDYPVVGDWNGDGRDTPGVVRGNTWFLIDEFDPNSTVTKFAFGKASDLPIAGDWAYAVD